MMEKVLVLKYNWRYKLINIDKNRPKWYKNLENFVLTPIFAIHSKNGIGIA